MAQPQNRNNNAVNDAQPTVSMAGRNVENIPQLLMVKVDQEHVDNGVQCTTCLETFILNEEVAKLKCQHIFHWACIQPWLQRNNTCPVCRAKVEWRREGVVNVEHRDLEAVDIDADAVQAVDNVDERIRQHEEQIRQHEERIRQIEEEVRQINEQIRQNNEQIRQNNEQIRQNRKAQAIAIVGMVGLVIGYLASLFTGGWF